MIDDHGWKWPQNWLNKYSWLTNVPVPTLIDTPDKTVWIDCKGDEKAFATRTVWKDVRGSGNKVCWNELVWHSHCIPKHSFILWLAIKTKLCTQDKLAKWYPNKSYNCSLCGKGNDSHDHLFFNWEFANEVWKKVCDIAKIEFKRSAWEVTVENISKEKNGKSVWVVIRKISVAAAVCYIWQERNRRLFNNCKRSSDEVFENLYEDLRDKMTTITVKHSANVCEAEQLWNTKFQRKAVLSKSVED